MTRGWITYKALNN